MQRYTLLIIPENRARVRRLQIAANKVKWLAWGVGLAALGLSLAGVDYVRARLDTRELASLRAESSQQHGELTRLERSVGQLEDRLTRLRELERKVRVITDLPSAVAESKDGQPGMGGGLDARPRVDPKAPAAAPAPGVPSSPEAVPQPAPSPSARVAPRGASPQAVRVARLHADAGRLEAIAREQEVSLAELVDRLQGKSRRLASTPSIWPSRGWVTSGYGHRISPFTGLRQFHGGIDIAAEIGTRVVAPARGRVVFVGRKGPLGKSIVIDHGYGMRTTYGHNKTIDVAQGEVIERGQQIAQLGNSGRSTGPHLHYAVYLNGRAVNPFNYILE